MKFFPALLLMVAMVLRLYCPLAVAFSHHSSGHLQLVASHQGSTSSQVEEAHLLHHKRRPRAHHNPHSLAAIVIEMPLVTAVAFAAEPSTIPLPGVYRSAPTPPPPCRA